MGRVIVRQDPVRLDRVVWRVDGRATVRSCVRRAFPRALADDLVVVLNGTPLPPEEWGRRVGRDDILVVALRPAGPAAVLAAAQLATALASAGAAYGAVTALGLTGAAALFVGTAVAGTVSALGGLLLRSLVQPPSLGSRGFEGSKQWLATAPRNEARLFEPVPIVLGRHRLVPPYAAQPIYATRAGNRDALLLLCWGEGPVELDDLRAGDTPLTSLEHEHQFWPGDPDAGTPALTLYSSDVDVLQLDVELPEPPNGQAGSWFQQTTAPDTVRAELLFTFPSGFQSIGRNTGDLFSRSTDIEIETSPVGAGQWVSRGTFRITRNTTAAFVHSISIAIDGQADIRIRRWGHPGQGRASRNAMVWTALHSFHAQAPVTASGVALSAIRVLGTQESAASLGAINGIITSIVPDWNGVEWAPAPTRNPASLARFLLAGRHNPDPLDPAVDLDDQAWTDWWTECDTRGWTCDLVVDWRSSIAEVLRIVAQCGHAQIVYRDGRWTPVIDLPREAVSVITPRNARDIRYSRDLTERPHALRVQYLDADEDWARREVVVYADGYDSATAERFDTLEVPGVTSRTAAWRQGRLRLREMEVRADAWSFAVGFEHVGFSVGDRIEIAHDLIASTAGFGRIVDVSLDGAGQTLSVTLDAEIRRDPALSYAARIRRAAGTIGTWTLQAGGSGRVLTFDPPIPDGQAPEAGDLVTVGETAGITVPATVLRIAPQDLTTATVECVRYDESLFDVYDETPADLPPAAGSATSPIPPSIVGVSVELGTIVAASVVISHGRPPEDATALRVQWRETGADTWSQLEAAADAALVRLTPLVQGRTYEVRVAYASAAQGGWSTIRTFSTATADSDAISPVVSASPDPTLVDLGQYIADRIAAGETYIRPASEPGTSVYVPGLVRIEVPDPARTVTVDLSALRIRAGAKFRLSIRSSLDEQPEQNQYLLYQDAAAGATTIRVRTTPQGGDHSLLAVGRRLVIRGQNDASGDVLDGQYHEAVITAKTVVNSEAVDITLDTPLPSLFKVSYPESEWIEDGGGVDQTHITVLTEVALAADAPAGARTLSVVSDPAALGFAAGDLVAVVDDMVGSDVQGSSTFPIRRTVAEIEAIDSVALTITLQQALEHDFATSRNARIVRVRPSGRVILIEPADVEYVEPPEPAPASRIPYVEFRYVRDCRAPTVTLDDDRNPNGYAPRGAAVRFDHALRCSVGRLTRIGKRDPSDATSGDRYGWYGVHSRECLVHVDHLTRCRHGGSWANSVDCHSYSGILRDNLINGFDTHGLQSVGCFHHGGLFIAGPSRAPDASNQAAATFGNTAHLAGDYRCGIIGAVCIGFGDSDGAVEVRTPCGDIVVDVTAIDCLHAVSLKPSGTLDGGYVYAEGTRWIAPQAGGSYVNDETPGSPAFAGIRLPDPTIDPVAAVAGPLKPSGATPIMLTPPQDQALQAHEPDWQQVSGSITAEYGRGQMVRYELTGDVTSFAIDVGPARIGTTVAMTVAIRQDATGGHAWVHPTGTRWEGGAPPALSTSPGAEHWLQYVGVVEPGGSVVWTGLIVLENVA